ncbi:MAG TPA: ABC transporter permease [Terriglobales bacterium]|jgi:putative ABC transport system permease protein
MSATPFEPVDVAARRAGRSHTSMFLRMMMRAAVLRKARAASALVAMVVAAAVATAMLNLYADVQAKLRKEFRNYGANIIVAGPDGASLPAGTLQKVEIALDGRGLAVPFAYVVARTAEGKSVVVAGTDFNRVRQLNRWWDVTHWPEASPSHEIPVLVGTRAASVVSPDGKPFTLTFQGRALLLSPTGTLQTGAAEDSRVYIPLSDFQSWIGVQPSTIEISATGSTDEINSALHRLAVALPGVEVRPVRQIMEAEANVLGKTRSALFASCVLIILTAALCVLATLMGWVFDRRRDFAIMKALGASGRLLNAFFAAEAAALGVVGALLGFVLGIGIAVWIGRANFHAPVVPRFSVFPLVLAGSVLVALLSAVLPIGLLRRVQPAIILRGE